MYISLYIYKNVRKLKFFDVFINITASNPKKLIDIDLNS